MTKKKAPKSIKFNVKLTEKGEKKLEKFKEHVVDTTQLMNLIASEMEKGKPNAKLLEELNKKLDKALGTDLKDEDLSLAEAFEQSR